MPFRLPSVESAPRLSDGYNATMSTVLPAIFCQFDQLLPVMNLWQYSQPAQPVPTKQLDPWAAQEMYQNALHRAQNTISQAWEPNTIQRRDKTMQELSQWLSQLPRQWEKSLMTCTPADLIAFMQDHWLEAHAGTTLPDGSLISSPSGVNRCLSSMSTGFNLIGRVTSWTPETPSGNPIQSSLVSSYRKGYRLGAWRSGYLEGSAVPISEVKVHQLVEYLDSLVPSSPPTLARLVVERDALLALLMWETSMRGKNCGNVTLSDFFQSNGQSLELPLPSPMPIGSLLTLRPNGTKTVKGRRSRPFVLTVGDGTSPSFLGRLPAYLKYRMPDNAPGSAFLFSPLTSDRRQFKDSCMSASDIGKRMRHHLERAAMYAAESNHGFKRGHMQALSTAGMPPADIGKKVQINTATTVEKYLDPSRHLPRLERSANLKRLHAQL